MSSVISDESPISLLTALELLYLLIALAKSRLSLLARGSSTKKASGNEQKGNRDGWHWWIAKLEGIKIFGCFWCYFIHEMPGLQGKNKRMWVKAAATQTYKLLSFPMFGKLWNNMNDAKLSVCALCDSLTILAISVL